ncbi:MAG: arginine repressor, partial [Planctomycetota bacterium]|nr:arginine repressor [Planctomycetota bacterium]
AAASADPLIRGLRQWLRAATPAQNLVVLRTPPGGASPLGVVLDAHGPEAIVGTIAGDDTIRVVTPSSAAAAQLALDFGRHAGGADR